MKNKQNTFSSQGKGIKTKHVFLKDEQVFLKKENSDILFNDREIAEWFPTNFNWISTVI